MGVPFYLSCYFVLNNVTGSSDTQKSQKTQFWVKYPILKDNVYLLFSSIQFFIIVFQEVNNVGVSFFPHISVFYFSSFWEEKIVHKTQYVLRYSQGKKSLSKFQSSNTTFVLEECCHHVFWNQQWKLLVTKILQKIRTTNPV